MTYNIYSININGLRSQNKQHYITIFISDNRVDILCLQETHTNNRKSANIIKRFISLDFKYIWSFGQGQSCGVCKFFLLILLYLFLNSKLTLMGVLFMQTLFLMKVT